MTMESPTQASIPIAIPSTRGTLYRVPNDYPRETMRLPCTGPVSLTFSTARQNRYRLQGFQLAQVVPHIMRQVSRFEVGFEIRIRGLRAA